jgi:hypothetical protein
MLEFGKLIKGRGKENDCVREKEREREREGKRESGIQDSKFFICHIQRMSL